MGCAHSVRPFIPNEGVPGQGREALADFEKIGPQPKNVAKLYRVFRRIDRDASHKISKPEFFEFFRLKDSVFAHTAFNVLNRDGSGQMDFHEFVLSVWNYLTFEPERIIEFAFALYDSDQSSYLDRDEIEKLVMDVYNKGDGYNGMATGCRVDRQAPPSTE